MDGGRNPSQVPNQHNFFSNGQNLSEYLPIVINDGIDVIALVITAVTGTIPRTHPKLLKEELSRKVTNKQDIDSVHLSRQGKLFLTTKFSLTAQQLLAIDSLLGVPVKTFIQSETVSTRFLLHNIDTSVACSDIAAELEEQGIHILEVRRFIRKVQNTEQPTQSVLVTIIGTSLPADVKLWYQLHRISPFYDKPRPCLKCHRYNHSTRNCRSNAICIKCAETHDGECTSSVLKCINCSQAHAANDKLCPAYQKEARLQQFRSSHHLTLSEARRRFREADNTQTTSTTFAAIAAPPPIEILSQSVDAMLQTLSDSFTQKLEAVLQETFAAKMDEMVQGFANSIKLACENAVDRIQEAFVKMSSKINITTPLKSFDPRCLSNKKLRTTSASPSNQDSPIPMEASNSDESSMPTPVTPIGLPGLKPSLS